MRARQIFPTGRGEGAVTRRAFLVGGSAVAGSAVAGSAVAGSAAATIVACGSSDDVVPADTGGAGGSPPGAGGAGQGGGGAAGAGGQGGEGGGPPTPYAPGPEPADPWAAPGIEDTTAFGWGVQSGDALPDAVLVGTRTLEATVTLTLMRGVESGWEEVSSAEVFRPVDGVVQLELLDLAPDTTYALAFYAENSSRRSRVARFRTALPAGARRLVRFGATSCLGGANGAWPCLSRSFDERLDFFLLLGDTIYADNGPDTFDYVEKFRTALAEAGLQDATAGTSVVATWDDHEIDNNWSWSDSGIQQKFDEAVAAFRQAIPQRAGSGLAAIWRKLSWGDAVDLFVLDCRSERENGNYVSPEQLAWLKQALSDSGASFKVILNSVPIFDFTGTALGFFGSEDRWQGYPSQRDEILAHVSDNAIGGVVWLSGDVHFAAVGQVDATGSGPGEGAWDVIVGPAGSTVNPAAALLPENARMPVVVREHNWALFEADPDAGTLLVRFIDNDGATIREHTLTLG
jgi:alkaline phosphatase D